MIILLLVIATVQGRCATEEAEVSCLAKDCIASCATSQKISKFIGDTALMKPVPQESRPGTDMQRVSSAAPCGGAFRCFKEALGMTRARLYAQPYQPVMTTEFILYGRPREDMRTRGVYSAFRGDSEDIGRRKGRAPSSRKSRARAKAFRGFITDQSLRVRGCQ